MKIHISIEFEDDRDVDMYVRSLLQNLNRLDFIKAARVQEVNTTITADALTEKLRVSPKAAKNIDELLSGIVVELLQHIDTFGRETTVNVYCLGNTFRQKLFDALLETRKCDVVNWSLYSIVDKEGRHIKFRFLQQSMYIPMAQYTIFVGAKFFTDELKSRVRSSSNVVEIEIE